MDVSSRYGYVGKGLEDGALPLFLFSFTMKNTIIMLAVIGTFIATAMFSALVVWCVNDLSYQGTIAHPLFIMLMLIFGWFPCVIVGGDLSDKLSK